MCITIIQLKQSITEGLRRGIGAFGGTLLEARLIQSLGFRQVLVATMAGREKGQQTYRYCKNATVFHCFINLIVWLSNVMKYKPLGKVETSMV